MGDVDDSNAGFAALQGKGKLCVFLGLEYTGGWWDRYVLL